MLHGVSFRSLGATDRALLTRATLGNLNWRPERFSVIDVHTRAELSHYALLDPHRGDFGWMAQTGTEAVGVVWAQ